MVVSSGSAPSRSGSPFDVSREEGCRRRRRWFGWCRCVRKEERRRPLACGDPPPTWCLYIAGGAREGKDSRNRQEPRGAPPTGSMLGLTILDQPLELLADDRLGELGDHFPGDLLDDLPGGLAQGLAQGGLAPVTRTTRLRSRRRQPRRHRSPIRRLLRATLGTRRSHRREGTGGALLARTRPRRHATGDRRIG